MPCRRSPRGPACRRSARWRSRGTAWPSGCPRWPRWSPRPPATPALWASWLLARFSSSRVMANHRSSGTSGALALAIRQLVLQGLPTTSTRTSEAALAAMALPCGPKIPPLTVRRSPRSMPALRGTDPTSRAHEVPSKAVCEVGGGHDVADQGERTVVDLHHHAIERLHARLDLEEAQHHGLVRSEELARGDPEEEGVADLAGGPGDRDVDWSVGCHGAEANRRRRGRVEPAGGGRGRVGARPGVEPQGAMRPRAE